MLAAFSLRAVIVAALAAFVFGGGWGVGEREKQQAFEGGGPEQPVAQISLGELGDNVETSEASSFLTGTLALPAKSVDRPPTAKPQAQPKPNPQARTASPPSPQPRIAVAPPPTPAPTPAVTVSVANTQQICSFATSQTPTHQGARLNEVAWMGSLASANDEWIELKNISAAPQNLSGWQLADKDEQIRVVFVDGDTIPSGGFYLLERTDDASVPGVTANKIYQGALGNTGEGLRLFNNQCILIDEALAAPNWPAGDAGTRKTMERNASDLNWHTSVSAGGTPKAENSVPVAPLSSSSGGSGSPSTGSGQGGGGGGGGSPPPPPPVMHTLSVLISGSGSGTVTSVPVGIACSPDCDEEYAQGTSVTLTAIPAENSTFDGWQNACTGTNACVLTISSNVTATAVFKAQASGQPIANNAQSSTLVAGPSASNSDHLVISEVQITGGPGQTKNDFIELYNPTANPMNLAGHRLVKRTAGATSDDLIKSWDADTFVPAYGFYLWANSEYVSIPAVPDATSADFISENNGIALRLGASNTGTIIDSVAWGAVTNGFGEGTLLPGGLAPGASYERRAWENGNCVSAQGSGANLGNGCDSNSNAPDFEVRPVSNPQNSQSSSEP